MVKTELSVGEVTVLNEELIDLVGLKLDLEAKYYINKLSKIAFEETELFNKLRNELIEKLGVKGENDQLHIPAMIDENEAPVVQKNTTGLRPTKAATVAKAEKAKAKNSKPKMIPNPALDTFATEMNKIASIKKEVEHYKFTPSFLKGLESDRNYPVLFKLIMAHDTPVVTPE